MAEKRKVFKDMTYKHLEKLNPFAEMPRMRLSEVNAINDLIERNNAIAVVRVENKYHQRGYIDHCPVCNQVLLEEQTFCTDCGQRLDRENIAF